jgi:hypothetical protein
MAQVRINGEESRYGENGSVKVVDLVELIKTQIDPEHIITDIFVNGQELTENDWTASVQNFGQTAVIEVSTGEPQAYVAERLSKSADIVRACFIDFRDARKFFQAGDSTNGNKKIGVAANTLKAFFEWYQTMLELMPETRRERFNLTEQIKDISECFKKACQHQLYQSWWALGETIQQELEPKLDKLEDFCRGITSEM